MTNGGVSKPTKSLHVSEDVFGGYNVMLRGRDITYVDYIAVGKGRDMGFETINTFEAKVSCQCVQRCWLVLLNSKSPAAVMLVFASAKPEQ